MLCYGSLTGMADCKLVAVGVVVLVVALNSEGSKALESELWLGIAVIEEDDDDEEEEVYDEDEGDGPCVVVAVVTSSALPRIVPLTTVPSLPITTTSAAVAGMNRGRFGF